MALNRRRFLQLSALSAIFGLTPERHGAGADAPHDLLRLLGPESVRELGHRYREIVPAWDLLAVRPGRGSLTSVVRDDFARGRTIVIQGWVLSVTEARQCALFSLLPS